MADVDDKMMLDSHSPVDRVDGDFFNDFGADDFDETDMMTAAAKAKAAAKAAQAKETKA